MKAFIDWILAYRFRLILIAVATAMVPFLQIVATALVVLDTLRRGASDAGRGAAIGAAATALLLLAAGANLAAGVVVAAVTFGAGIALGALVRWAGGLTPAFQGVVLFSLAAVVVVNLFGPGGQALLAPIFDLYVEILRESGATEAQIEAFRAVEPLVLGLVAGAVLTQWLAALFLAYWWRGLALGDTRFGTEFRGLRLSRALGLPASVLVAVAPLAMAAPLVQNLATLAAFGFLFQGLAVMHAWAHARQWRAMFVAPVYVLCITPLAGVVLMALCAIGLMDNWFDLRAPLRAQT